MVSFRVSLALSRASYGCICFAGCLTPRARVLPFQFRIGKIRRSLGNTHIILRVRRRSRPTASGAASFSGLLWTCYHPARNTVTSLPAERPNTNVANACAISVCTRCSRTVNVEQTIPPGVALSRIAVEATGYHTVPFGSEIFRVPEIYTITLNGGLNGNKSQEWKGFIGRLLRRLPPGSSVVSCVADSGKGSNTVPTVCSATLQAQANGNYFPLGVSKIDAEGNL